MKTLKKLTLSEIKKFLEKKGLRILYKKEQKFNLSGDFKNFYYTALSGLMMVLFFSVLPIINNIKKNESSSWLMIFIIL